jgi:hypothetical protein
MCLWVPTARDTREVHLGPILRCPEAVAVCCFKDPFVKAIGHVYQPRTIRGHSS